MIAVAGLQPAVVAALPRVFATWEGAALPYMYTDVKGKVTFGTGNLIDSPAAAIEAATWHHGTNGPVASADEVAAAWQTVKDAWPGVQSTASSSLTDLRADSASLSAKMNSTMSSFWSVLRAEFPGADKWPADAQLMILSNSWAWGPSFVSAWDGYFPGNLGTQFRNAIVKRNFAAASKIMKQANAHEMTINPGIVPRVAGQALMLQNAARDHFHPAKLYYPGTASRFGWGAAALALGAAAVGAMAAGPIGLGVGLVAALGGSSLSLHVSLAPVKRALHIGPPDPFAVQRKLAEVGLYKGKIDGDLGSGSQAAISAFQASRGLPKTGQMDATTRKAMGV